METYIRTIEGSALPDPIKTELKRLVTELGKAREDDAKFTAEVFKTKQDINEREYLRRLQEAKTDKRRNELMIIQFAWRDWFVNSVLRTHEVRCQRQSLATEIAAIVASLANESDESSKVALVALTQLARNEQISAQEVLGHLSTVSDLSRERALYAVQALFLNLKDQAGVFWGTNFSSQPFKVANPTDTQKCLNEAVDDAIPAYYALRTLARDFDSARHRLNVPEFTKRLEEALSIGASDKFAQFSAEQKDCEAALLVVASAYDKGYAAFIQAKQRLAEAIRSACAAIECNAELDTLKAMSNCNGAQHWLQKMCWLAYSESGRVGK
jgi:hypothetical protein